MKLREVTSEQLSSYLKIGSLSSIDNAFLEICKKAAAQYISNYTGLPLEADDKDCVNNHEDLTIAYLILVADMWDNRAANAEAAAAANRTLETILGYHRVNLL